MARQIFASFASISRVRFRVEEDGLVYHGSISMPAAEYASLEPRQIEAMQTEQFERWKRSRVQVTEAQSLQEQYDQLRSAERDLLQRVESVRAEALAAGAVLVEASAEPEVIAEPIAAEEGSALDG